MAFAKYLDKDPAFRGEEGEKKAGGAILPFLEEYCRTKGKHEKLHGKLSRKLVVELLLNRIQAFREAHPGLAGRILTGAAGRIVGMFF